MLGLTNGNMTTRTISGSTYTLGYDEENHLTSVSGAAMASFVYDGDGKRVKGTVNGVTTSYIGDYFEWSPSTENLVANPGFETTGNWTETTITGFASTWFFRSTWGTADQHSGTYGYAISNQMYGYLRSQEIAVSPGQYYDVNAYMRGLIDPEDSFGSVLVRAAFYTSGGAAVSNVDAATVSPGSLTTTWQKLGGVVQVPATAAKLYLQLFTYHNTGWVTFDDAEVYLSDAQGNHTGSNLVANPGFETTSGWTRVPSTSYPATTFARSNDTGTLMKGRSGYGHSISNLAWGEIYTSGFIPTTAGKQYDLYAWVRGELDSDANFGNYQLRLAFYDSAGNPVSSLNSYTGDPASISSTWANRGGRVTVPAGVTQMKVLLRVDEVSGWVDFDDVELYEVVGGQRTGGNLAPDPGFETGAGWATTATFPNSTSFFRSTWGTADQHSGSYGWVISNHMYGTLTSDSIAVTAGETYQVSAYLRGELDAEDSGGAWLIRVSYYNAVGTRISYEDVYTNSNNSFTGWQEKGDLTVAPAGAVSMTVAVWNYMNSSWIGFDDVRVTAVSMKKYYYAGGQRVAMREGAGTGTTGLSFLFGDHLGSMSVTASSSGTKTAEVRYKAWGEDRYTSGTTPTSYRFTGQRVESYINLYWYGSRWYDSALGRFVSPDPIMPDPYNPLAYDRYQYVYSNPVRFNDPSGHVACDGKFSGDTCSSSRWRFTTKDLKDALRYEYKWKVVGSWSVDELEVIYKAGFDIHSYVNTLSEGNANNWMDTYLGNISIIHAPIAAIDGGRPFALLNTVFMQEGWIGDINPHAYFTHELAHIWDDRTGRSLFKSTWFGGGASEGLMTYIGGNAKGWPKWNNGADGIPAEYRWSTTVRNAYGNNSTADYLAEGFSWLIYKPENLPWSGVLFWLQALIGLQSCR